MFRCDSRGPTLTVPERSPLADRLASSLDRGADRSLSRQIVDWIWRDIVDGTLETGERLPTARQLAVDLGLNPKVVTRAYDELTRLGVVSSRAGEGTFVALSVPDGERRARRMELESVARHAADRALGLGFAIDDLMDVLDELRSEGPSVADPEA